MAPKFVLAHHEVWPGNSGLHHMTTYRIGLFNRKRLIEGQTTAWARQRHKHGSIPTAGQSLPVSHRGNNTLSCRTESGSGSGRLSSLTSLPILLLLRRHLMVALLLLLSWLLWTLLLLSSHVLDIIRSLLASWIFWPVDTGRFMGSTHLSLQTNLPFSYTEPIGPFKGH